MNYHRREEQAIRLKLLMKEFRLMKKKAIDFINKTLDILGK